MTPTVQQWTSDALSQIETSLRDHLPLDPSGRGEALNGAVGQAVFSGGKRLRPILALASGSLVGLNDEDALLIACGVEFLHSASLILDDLPCMDDSPIRRGRRAVHVEHGEANAILAGVTLMNQAYRLFARTAGGREALELATECLGHSGMALGQSVDLAPAADRGDTHYLKTTALFRLAIMAPPVCAGTAEQSRAALEEFGRLAGRGYQLMDDATDLREDTNVAEDQLRRALLQEAAECFEQSDEAVFGHFGDRTETRVLRGMIDRLKSIPHTITVSAQKYN